MSGTKEIVTFDILKKAMMNAFEGLSEEAAKEQAEYVLNLFGFNDEIIDNALDPDDRSFFTMLEEEGNGILKERGPEEETLYDGRGWRIFYWVMNKDRIFELAGMVSPRKQIIEPDMKSVEDIYGELNESIWQHNVIPPKTKQKLKPEFGIKQKPTPQIIPSFIPDSARRYMHRIHKIVSIEPSPGPLIVPEPKLKPEPVFVPRPTLEVGSEAHEIVSAPRIEPEIDGEAIKEKKREYMRNYMRDYNQKKAALKKQMHGYYLQEAMPKAIDNLIKRFEGYVLKEDFDLIEDWSSIGFEPKDIKKIKKVIQLIPLAKKIGHARKSQREDLSINEIKEEIIEFVKQHPNADPQLCGRLLGRSVIQPYFERWRDIKTAAGLKVRRGRSFDSDDEGKRAIIDFIKSKFREGGERKPWQRRVLRRDVHSELGLHTETYGFKTFKEAKTAALHELLVEDLRVNPDLTTTEILRQHGASIYTYKLDITKLRSEALGRPYGGKAFKSKTEVLAEAVNFITQEYAKGNAENVNTKTVNGHLGTMIYDWGLDMSDVYESAKLQIPNLKHTRAWYPNAKLTTTIKNLIKQFQPALATELLEELINDAESKRGHKLSKKEEHQLYGSLSGTLERLAKDKDIFEVGTIGNYGKRANLYVYGNKMKSAEQRAEELKERNTITIPGKGIIAHGSATFKRKVLSAIRELYILSGRSTTEQITDHIIKKEPEMSQEYSQIMLYNNVRGALSQLIYDGLINAEKSEESTKLNYYAPWYSSLENLADDSIAIIDRKMSKFVQALEEGPLTLERLKEKVDFDGRELEDILANPHNSFITSVAFETEKEGVKDFLGQLYNKEIVYLKGHEYQLGQFIFKNLQNLDEVSERQLVQYFGRSLSKTAQANLRLMLPKYREIARQIFSSVIDPENISAIEANEALGLVKGPSMGVYYLDWLVAAGIMQKDYSKKSNPFKLTEHGKEFVKELIGEVVSKQSDELVENILVEDIEPVYVYNAVFNCVTSEKLEEKYKLAPIILKKLFNDSRLNNIVLLTSKQREFLQVYDNVVAELRDRLVIGNYPEAELLSKDIPDAPTRKELGEYFKRRQVNDVLKFYVPALREKGIDVVINETFGRFQELETAKRAIKVKEKFEELSTTMQYVSYADLREALKIKHNELVTALTLLDKRGIFLDIVSVKKKDMLLKTDNVAKAYDEIELPDLPPHIREIREKTGFTDYAIEHVLKQEPELRDRPILSGGNPVSIITKRKILRTLNKFEAEEKLIEDITDGEVAEAVGLHLHTVHKQRKELEDAGLIPVAKSRIDPDTQWYVADYIDEYKQLVEKKVTNHEKIILSKIASELKIPISTVSNLKKATGLPVTLDDIWGPERMVREFVKDPSLSVGEWSENADVSVGKIYDYVNMFRENPEELNKLIKNAEQQLGVSAPNYIARIMLEHGKPLNNPKIKAYKAFGNSERMKIMKSLCGHKGEAVGLDRVIDDVYPPRQWPELSRGYWRSTYKYHFTVLKDAGLIEIQRDQNSISIKPSEKLYQFEDIISEWDIEKVVPEEHINWGYNKPLFVEQLAESGGPLKLKKIIVGMREAKGCTPVDVPTWKASERHPVHSSTYRFTGTVERRHGVYNLTSDYSPHLSKLIERVNKVYLGVV